MAKHAARLLLHNMYVALLYSDMTVYGECCFVGTLAELQLAPDATRLNRDRSCFDAIGTRRTV
jgi:hypothetical protein